MLQVLGCCCYALQRCIALMDSSGLVLDDASFAHQNIPLAGGLLLLQKCVSVSGKAKNAL